MNKITKWKIRKVESTDKWGPITYWCVDEISKGNVWITRPMDTFEQCRQFVFSELDFPTNKGM